MKNELTKKASLTMELTIDVDINFAYNGDSLFDYYVWLDAGYSNPIDIYPCLNVKQQIDIEEAIEERIQEIKNEGN